MSWGWLLQEVLDKENIGEGAFKVQFAVYRNYNSDADLLLAHSQWEQRPADLRSYVDNVRCSGARAPNPPVSWGPG